MQITGFFHAAKPGSMRTDESTSKLLTDQVLLNDDLTFGPLFKMEDPDLHYLYVCIKVCIPIIILILLLVLVWMFKTWANWLVNRIFLQFLFFLIYSTCAV
jgi:hypothetical protein